MFRTEVPHNPYLRTHTASDGVVWVTALTALASKFALVLYIPWIWLETRRTFVLVVLAASIFALALDVAFMSNPVLAMQGERLRPARRGPRLHEDGSKRLTPGKRPPAVDVFVTCCGEPIQVIQTTICALLDTMSYPADAYDVFVLDDGDDARLRAWVLQLQLQRDHTTVFAHTPSLVYIARSKLPGVPHLYKAGNMNHALAHQDIATRRRPYVIQMDADMFPHPDYITVLVRAMEQDAGLAYAYCAQCMYNTGDHDLLEDNQTVNYASFNAKFANAGVAPNGGSGVIWNHELLVERGGFNTESTAEDFLTSWDMLLRGHKSEYIPIPLQSGLAPRSLNAWYRQRSRWYKGLLEIHTLLRRRVCTSAVLTLTQKVLLMQHTARYYGEALTTAIALALCCAFLAIPGIEIVAVVELTESRARVALVVRQGFALFLIACATQLLDAVVRARDLPSASMLLAKDIFAKRLNDALILQVALEYVSGVQRAWIPTALDALASKQVSFGSRVWEHAKLVRLPLLISGVRIAALTKLAMLCWTTRAAWMIAFSVCLVGALELYVPIVVFVYFECCVPSHMVTPPAAWIDGHMPRFHIPSGSTAFAACICAPSVAWALILALWVAWAW